MLSCNLSYADRFLYKDEERNLTHVPSVYFIVDNNDKILYIGETTNLRKRLTSHHKKSVIPNFKECKIAFVKVKDDATRRIIEKKLISSLVPTYNTVNYKGISNAQIKIMAEQSNFDFIKDEYLHRVSLAKRNLNKIMGLLDFDKEPGEKPEEEFYYEQ